MIAIGLNLILGVLLSCALVLGLRLERRLRGLRQSQQDFAKAVSELDQAAARTEHSLAALRAGTETAKNEVASRIDQARLACQRLEKLTADAERLASQPLALSRGIEVAPALAQAAPAQAEPIRPAAPVQVQPPPAPQAAARSRAKLVDDDLFSTSAPPPRRSELAEAKPRAAEPVFVEPAPVVAEPSFEIHADNDPLVGVPTNRAAREAFYRQVLDRETFAADPFADAGDFARERRAMLAAVMGGRR
jgi:hypothetical protein